jgi:hypothetical protein
MFLLEKTNNINIKKLILILKYNFVKIVLKILD